jgi:hypothetical protein
VRFRSGDSLLRHWIRSPVPRHCTVQNLQLVTCAIAIFLIAVVSPAMDGSILFIPTARGLDVFARSMGRLLYRVALPDAPASGNDPLVLGGGTNVLAIITGSGVDFVDMSSLPISTAVRGGFPEPSYQPSSSNH